MAQLPPADPCLLKVPSLQLYHNADQGQIVSKQQKAAYSNPMHIGSEDWEKIYPLKGQKEEFS
jgi:hypothetical protein